MNATMCFLCISLMLLVLLATYQSLATALWICWHCNGGKIKLPVNNRLLDSQQAFDFHLKYLHGPKKLRIRMNEDYPSTCPHNSGSFAFMLNIVSGWSDSSEGLLYRVFLTRCSIEGCYIVCYSYACNGLHDCVYSYGRLVFSSVVDVVFVSSLSPSAMSLLWLLLIHVISYSRMCSGLTWSSFCMAVSRM